MGIEPTQAVLETASPALEHSPLYPAFAYPPERVRVLSNARFNAGKSNGPSRSHALLTGHNARQVWACRNIAPVRCQLWDLVQTAGLEPAHTSRRGALPTELRLHTPGIRRGQEERKDGWNEDTDITPHPHSDTYFSMLAPNQGQRLIFFAIL